MHILRIILYTFLTFLFLTNGNAKTRNLDDAKNLAMKFLSQSSGKISKMPFNIQSLKPVNSFSLTYNSESENSDLFFHIFNIGDNNGFVIVSANDKAKTILGYSDSGTFDINNISDSFKGWLEVYKNEIEFLNKQPDNTFVLQSITTENTDANNTVFATSISPLLRKTKWNQGTPYNNLCPIIDSINNSRAVTGCGATAMAQVMKYYNWPVKGTGSNTYTTKTLKIPLSVNFTTTQYDWTNMSDTYNSTSTDIQKTAVATLMYHCGVAANMDFNKSSSSFTTDIAKSLIKYFGYDQNLQVYIRDHYTRSEWEGYLKTELNAARPVLYNGQASDEGHIFVCDGYDSNGLYHFNWGWGGTSDGYFELTALNPTELGIGGGNAGGYNSQQYMIKGIRKPSTTSTPVYIIHTDHIISSSVDSTGRSSAFNINTLSIFNRGINTFTGNIGVGLYNGNTLIQTLKFFTTTNLMSFYGWTGDKKQTFNSVTISNTVENGNYKLYLIYKPSTEANWTIMRGKIGTANYLNVTVASNYIKIKAPTDALPKLTLNSLNKTGNLYQNKTGRFIAKINNSGNEYNSKIAIYLQSVDNIGVNQFVTTDPENISAAETKEMSFNGLITLPPGQYDLSLMYDANNNPANTITWTQLGNKLSVEILTEPTGIPTLSLVNSIAFPEPDKVFKSNATINATIKNTGGYFENTLTAFIFPKTSGSSLGYIGRQTNIIDQNETKTISFTGEISLDPNDYRIGIYYWDLNNPNSNKWTRMTPNDYSLIPFNLKEDITSNETPNYEEGVLFPNPAKNQINLKLQKNVTQITIFDVCGKEIRNILPENPGLNTIDISDLPNGIYIISSQSDKDNKISRFIKK